MKIIQHSSKTWVRSCALVTALSVLTLCPLRAQLVNDGATNSLSNVTHALIGDLTVGTNGSFTLLVLSDNAVLTNSSQGTVGSGTPATFNEVQLVSPTARWLIGNQLFVGSNGSFNRLVVSNGATVADFHGFLGSYASASSNAAVVTGAGSTWSNVNLFRVGWNGAGNHLVINNGGTGWNNLGSVGLSLTSSNNVAVVTGSGSLWTNTGELQVGFHGAGNQLVVSNGGLVASAVGSIGKNTAASNNLGLITGSGSTWSNQGVLYVGETGTSNRLIISNGGLVQCGFAEIGRNGLSAGNEAVVTGSGSTWTMPGVLLVGDDGSQNRLVVSNGATLRTRSGFLAGFLSSSNTAVVTGSGSLWTNVQDLNIGLSGPGNRLLVSAGGRVVSSNGIVGADPGSSHNYVQITDPGSVWTNSSSLFVGRSGSGNQLAVINGGTVVSGNHGFLGYNANANMNSAIVTGAGSSWLIASNLYVGSNGSSCALIIDQGGVVQNRGSTIGSSFAGGNNLAIVNGVGSTWRNSDVVRVGYDSAANQLVVSDGGLLLSKRAEIGAESGTNNLAIVTGPGSLWSNTADMVIGRFRAGNQLVVDNGARMETSSAGLGVNYLSSNNTALISGPGSVWKLATDLYVGSAPANRVTISNGAALYSARGYVGFSDLGSNNEVVITGPGSVWTNESVAVGNVSSGNRLVLTNGALLRTSETVTIGTFSPAAGNRLIVDSATLLLTNAIGTGQLTVRGGTNVLNSGLIEVDQLSAPDPLGKFELNSGTFSVKSTVYNNGRVFDVGAGGGFGPAVLNLAGNGVHFFANGLDVKSNGTVLGNGAILGTVTVRPLGTLSPGASIGKLSLNSTPSLAGITAMEISKAGIVLTNDQIQVTAPLTYGSSLIVTKLGPSALTSGDRFQLFSATAYTGSFSSISLPPLGAGLTWTNKLAVDGSIEVLGLLSPRIESIIRSGTNLVMRGTNGPGNGTYYVLASTNIALPLTNWTRVLTNQFSGNGNFSFTNPINPALPRRFFVLEVP